MFHKDRSYRVRNNKSYQRILFSTYILKYSSLCSLSLDYHSSLQLGMAFFSLDSKFQAKFCSSSQLHIIPASMKCSVKSHWNWTYNFVLEDSSCIWRRLEHGLKPPYTGLYYHWLMFFVRTKQEKTRGKKSRKISVVFIIMILKSPSLSFFFFFFFLPNLYTVKII